MFLFLFLAYNPYEPDLNQCPIDRCEGKYCVVETPEGTVEILRKRKHKEGMFVECPLWLIDPT